MNLNKQLIMHERCQKDTPLQTTPENIIKQAIKAHTIKGTIAIIIPFIAFIKNNVSLFTGKL